MKLGVVVADNPWWSGAKQQFLAHAKSYGVVPKDVALVCPGFNNLKVAAPARKLNCRTSS